MVDADAGPAAGALLDVAVSLGRMALVGGTWLLAAAACNDSRSTDTVLKGATQERATGPVSTGAPLAVDAQRAPKPPSPSMPVAPTRGDLDAAAGTLSHPARPIGALPSSFVSPEDQASLGRRAAAGDCEAVYRLALHASPREQSDALMRRAANGNFPPAMLLVAESLIRKGGVDAKRGRLVLAELVDRQSVGAACRLVRCLQRRRCGEASRTKLLALAILGRSFALPRYSGVDSDGVLRRGLECLEDEEARLRQSLSKVEQRKAEAAAKRNIRRIRRTRTSKQPSNACPAAK